MKALLLEILERYDLDEWVEMENDDIDIELVIEQLEDMYEEYEGTYSDFEWNARISDCIRKLEEIKK